MQQDEKNLEKGKDSEQTTQRKLNKAKKWWRKIGFYIK